MTALHPPRLSALRRAARLFNVKRGKKGSVEVAHAKDMQLCFRVSSLIVAAIGLLHSEQFLLICSSQMCTPADCQLNLWHCMSHKGFCWLFACFSVSCWVILFHCRPWVHANLLCLPCSLFPLCEGVSFLLGALGSDSGQSLHHRLWFLGVCSHLKINSRAHFINRCLTPISFVLGLFKKKEESRCLLCRLSAHCLNRPHCFPWSWCVEEVFILTLHLLSVSQICSPALQPVLQDETGGGRAELTRITSPHPHHPLHLLFFSLFLPPNLLWGSHEECGEPSRGVRREVPDSESVLLGAYGSPLHVLIFYWWKGPHAFPSSD